MTHTPTPWRTEFHPLQKGNPATLIMQKGAEMYERWIAECPWGKDSDTDRGDGDGVRDCTAAEAQANAKFIVRAVNAHDALLAACKAAYEFLRDSGYSSEQLRSLKAAIAKATGETP